MSNIRSFQATAAITNNTTAANAELAVTTLAGLEVPDQGLQVAVRALVTVSLAASTTGLRIRIRRGVDATGAVVADSGAVTSGITASTVAQLAAGGVDAAPGTPAPFASYTVTVQTTAAGANSTVQQLYLQAICYS